MSKTRFYQKKCLWIVIAVLVFIRLLLPVAGLRAINWVLSEKLGSYQGHVEDFDLSLYRGAYQLQKIELRKRGTNLAPILTVEEVDLSLAWRELLQKRISMDVHLQRLVLNLIDSKKAENRQLGNEEESWQDALKAVVPLQVESLLAENSSITFTNQDVLKAMPVQLEKVELLMICAYYLFIAK